MNKNIDSIKIKSELLHDDFKRIKDYVQNHLNEDPNFYELCSCWIKFGGLVKDVWNYCNETGNYPIDEENKPCTNYNIALYDENLVTCMNEIQKIEKLRKIGEYGFLQENKDCYTLYSMIKYDSILGFIEGYSKEEQELLRKSISVPFYIYQEQQKDPNFKYSNKQEFYGMQLSLSEMKLSEDDTRVKIIHNILEDINKNSVWYEIDPISKESRSDTVSKPRK